MALMALSPTDPLTQIIPALVTLEQQVFDLVGPLGEKNSFAGIALDPPPDNILRRGLPCMFNVVEEVTASYSTHDEPKLIYKIAVVQLFANYAEGRHLGEWNEQTRQYYWPLTQVFAKHVQLDQLVDRTIANVTWALYVNSKPQIIRWTGVDYVANKHDLEVVVEMTTDVDG